MVGFSTPSYTRLQRNGGLSRRAEKLWNIMHSCTLCPRLCRADRLAGEKGFCMADANLYIASYGPHFGEESPLVGTGGSGTIFFSNCSLRCVFCINWEISHKGAGNHVSIEGLADIMLYLQDHGCHNINLVTPDHYLPFILKAVDIASGRGLRLPLVYNTSGWTNPDILTGLDGLIDVYLADFKFFEKDMAARYSEGAYSYPETCRKSLLEMHRQVGTAKISSGGLICRGLMIRHLVMPGKAGGTKRLISWISENLPKDTYVNIMSQYRPMYKAFEYPEISRAITEKEYEEAVGHAIEVGLTNLDIQGY